MGNSYSCATVRYKGALERFLAVPCMAGHSPRAVFDLVPVLDVARAIRDFDGGIVLVKRHCRHFPFRRFYDGQMFFMLKFGQGAPLRNRLVFVVTKRDFAARIALCAKFRRKSNVPLRKLIDLSGFTTVVSGISNKSSMTSPASTFFLKAMIPLSPDTTFCRLPELQGSCIAARGRKT